MPKLENTLKAHLENGCFLAGTKSDCGSLALHFRKSHSIQDQVSVSVTSLRSNSEKNINDLYQCCLLGLNTLDYVEYRDLNQSILMKIFHIYLSALLEKLYSEVLGTPGLCLKIGTDLSAIWTALNLMKLGQGTLSSAPNY